MENLKTLLQELELNEDEQLAILFNLTEFLKNYIIEILQNTVNYSYLKEIISLMKNGTISNDEGNFLVEQEYFKITNKNLSEESEELINLIVNSIRDSRRKINWGILKFKNKIEDDDKFEVEFKKYIDTLIKEEKNKFNNVKI